MTAIETTWCAGVILLASFVPGAAELAAAPRSGETVYQAECASCHSTAAPRMPTRESLAALSTATIVRALESGVMRVVGTFNLNGPERVAVAEYLTGQTYDPDWAPRQAGTCAEQAWPNGDVFARPNWNGWGNGPANTRFQSADSARLDAAQVGALELKWAFAFPGETIAESQPSVIGGRIFVGSRSGTVYALDAERGCVHWTYQADGPVKGALLIAPLAAAGQVDGAGQLGAFFGDLVGNTYALDAATGRELWRVRVDDHPLARIMGSVQLAEGRLLVPVTAIESNLAGSADARCCYFRGSVVALEPATGRQLWKRYTVPPAQKTGVNAHGIDMLGPSGAAIWSAPTYDEHAHIVYVGTGENYSNPPTETSDSILAIDVDNGELRWHYQGLAGDAWNMACGTADEANCPTDTGPDYDFGASPILATLADGRRLVIAAQKSGVVHALDADAGGKLLWRRQLANGGVLGGIEWGPASDGQRVYVSIADMRWNSVDLLDPELAVDPNAGGGLVALDLADGGIAWRAPAVDCSGRKQCSPAQTAAVTVIPGVVFAGSVSGELRAFDTTSGTQIWYYDTAREFDTVNGAAGRGGALDATGPVIVDGWLYVASGYSKWGGLPGNVLLAFARK